MKKGFTPIVVAIAVLISLVLIVFTWKLINPVNNLRNYNKPLNPQNDNGSINIKNKTLRLPEGSQTVILNRITNLLLPSRSLIVVTSSGPYFFFDQNEINDFTKGLIVNKLLSVYNKGYVYEIENKTCTKEEVTHEDYTLSEDKECTLSITVSKRVPANSNYNGFSKKFSSQSTDRYSTLITSGQNEPFLTIVTPYTQLYRNSASKQYEFTSPIGDTLIVYNNYGSAKFQFSKEDLNNNASKSEKTGSLTLTVKVEGLSCYAPYLDASGGCNASKSSPVYNKVDFRLDIVEDKTIQEEPKILDYKW